MDVGEKQGKREMGIPWLECNHPHLWMQLLMNYVFGPNCFKYCIIDSKLQKRDLTPGTSTTLLSLMNKLVLLGTRCVNLLHMPTARMRHSR